jgi:hypothetical protein
VCDAAVGGAEQADVRDALASHEKPVEPESEGEPMPAGDSGAGENLGMRQAALPNLHPLPASVHVDLTAIQGVGVNPGFGPVDGAGQQGVDEQPGHLVHVVIPQRPPGHAPQIELVRRCGVQPIDRVAPVHDAGADEQHVIDGVGGQGAQRRRDRPSDRYARVDSLNRGDR